MSGKYTARLVWLLVLQLAVVAGLFVGRTQFEDEAAGPLLVFDPAVVDRIEIDEGESAPAIDLVRVADGWQVDTRGAGAVQGGEALPADAARVAELLDKLGGLVATWPAGTSASARQRFEVADQNYQRRVRLLVDGRAVGELLLGTAPGFRRLHVRIPGTDEAYEVDLMHTDLPTGIDEWLERSLLQADGQVTAIERQGDWRLARSDAGWLLADGAADSAAAEQMVERVANLRVLGVAPPAAAAETPAGEFEVSDARGAYRLTLAQAADSPEFVVTSDRVPGRFRLAAFVAEQLLVDAATLLPEARAAGGQSEAAND